MSEHVYLTPSQLDALRDIRRKCRWTDDGHSLQTECGNVERSRGRWDWCPYCGGKIVTEDASSTCNHPKVCGEHFSQWRERAQVAEKEIARIKSLGVCALMVEFPNIAEYIKGAESQIEEQRAEIVRLDAARVRADQLCTDNCLLATQQSERAYKAEAELCECGRPASDHRVASSESTSAYGRFMFPCVITGCQNFRRSNNEQVASEESGHREAPPVPERENILPKGVAL